MFMPNYAVTHRGKTATMPEAYKFLNCHSNFIASGFFSFLLSSLLVTDITKHLIMTNYQMPQIQKEGEIQMHKITQALSSL